MREFVYNPDEGSVIYAHLLEEERPSVGDWISVDKETPEIGKKVLVNIERKKVSDRVMTGIYVDNPFRWYAGGFGAQNVTHWMPLPEPVGQRD